MEYIKKLYLKKSILSLGPVLIDKIINLSEKDKRPSIFNTSIFDNIGAFFMSCDHIIDNIYLGSCLAACDYELLLNNNIKYLCNISDNVPNFFKNEIEYFNIKKKDNGQEDITRK